ncbi:MAG: hypothetical protein EOM67_09335 [Spirochaetia bacterium]|nr:hypothetical protein [Spirochaetia bacterium]
MKQSNLLQTIILLLGVLLLTVGCNTDGEGLFYLVSQSEESVNVGAVTLIGSTPTDLFAHTDSSGLQRYTISSGAWTSIPASVTPVLANQVSTDGTNIYYSGRSGEGENNKLYSFVKSGIPDYSSSVASLNNTYDILSMLPQHDLMTTREGTDIKVRKVSDGTEIASHAGTFVDALLLAQGNYSLSSGYTGTSPRTYTHTLFDGTNSTVITLKDGTTSVTDAVIKAFFIDGTNIAVVTGGGDVYFKTGLTITGAPTELAKNGNVPLSSSTVTLSPLPVVHEALSSTSSTFFVQGLNNYMYEIDPADGTAVEKSFSTIALTVQVSSFLEANSKYYIGTVSNGILEITFPL